MKFFPLNDEVHVKPFTHFSLSRALSQGHKAEPLHKPDFCFYRAEQPLFSFIWK